MTAEPTRQRRRGYTSPRRQRAAEQTRDLIVTAAASLFAERGWATTGMRDVAKEAGVAVETVYSNFASKAELLLQAIDVGVVGDAEPVPLSDRDEFAALSVGNYSDRLAAAARMITAINQRSWGLQQALRQAAASEPHLAARYDELQRRRRDNVRAGAELVIERPVDDDTLDALWVLLGTEVFVLITQTGGRSAEDYQRWLTATVGRVLAPSRTAELPDSPTRSKT